MPVLIMRYIDQNGCASTGYIWDIHRDHIDLCNNLFGSNHKMVFTSSALFGAEHINQFKL